MPTNLRILIAALCLVLLGSVAASAQINVKPPQLPSARPQTPGRPPDDPMQNSSTREMLKEMELRREENDYKEHIARAKETAHIAAELQEAFARQKTLSAPEVKKLSRMEKLARQIRSRAGGEENKDELKEIPEPARAFELLATLSSELEKKVESTPRHVVSSAIIKRANEIVELVKHLRTIYR